MSKFTTILHEARKAAGMSMNEYVLTDTIHHLSRDRWCNMSRDTMANEFGLSKRGIISVIDRLCDEGWIEKEEKGALRTTEKWHSLIYTSGAKNTPDTVQKVHSVGAKSAPNIYIDNNNIDNNKETIVSYNRKPRNNDIDVLISAMKTTLASKGYMYSNIKERIFGMHISKNTEWKALLEENNMTGGEALTKVMEWTHQDTFWNGKICSLQTFYYKWGMLVNKMKQEGKWRALNAKLDEDKKRQAEAFFASL